MDWKLPITLISVFFCLPAAQAADGSGFATVVPNSVVQSSTGNDFTFTYTATEEMGNGAARLTIPDGFADPTPNNTTVTVVDGMSADIIDDLEANPLPEGTPGWNATEDLPVVDLVTVNADTQEFFEGGRSLEVNFLVIQDPTHGAAPV